MTTADDEDAGKDVEERFHQAHESPPPPNTGPIDRCGGNVPPRPAAGPQAKLRSAGCYPVIVVQAVTHFWNGTQSLLPLPHWASGVFQNLIDLK